MSSLRPILFALLAIVMLAVRALAAETVVARVDPADSALRDTGDAVELSLSLSQPVTWRVFVVDAPRRLVLDLSKADWPDAFPDTSDLAGPVDMGRFDTEWSRMVVPLGGPLVIGQAALETDPADGSARLTVALVPVSETAFVAHAQPADSVMHPARPVAPPRQDGVLRVMLDPGHGGVDPGAEADGLVEADLMLTFAQELRAVLSRQAGYAVGLTRDDDSFVPLEARITAARAFGADVLLSLHADALPEDAGQASGATVYTLSEEASDKASQILAERHDRSDLIAGVDLEDQGDEIAIVLMDLVRRETAPRADALAGLLVDAFRDGTGHVSSRPLRRAGFSVLKAPDFPSVLLELGFLSSREDRARLADPAWRTEAAQAILTALQDWRAVEGQGTGLTTSQ